MLLFYDGQFNNTIPRLENVLPRLGEFSDPLGRIHYPDGPFKTYSGNKAHPYG